MLHKIFHMNQSIEETKRRLANVSGYRHHLDGVQQADFSADNISTWKLLLPLGFRTEFSLSYAVDEDTVAFKSLDGNLELSGMVCFQAVKHNLTEIDLVMNYESKSTVFNLLDRMLNIGDHYLMNQLRRVRTHFEGIAVPTSATASEYHSFKQAIA